MPKIIETGNYITAYKELILKQANLEPLVRQRVKWFRKNPQDTRLDNHILKRKMQGKFAFSITDDIRIVYHNKEIYG